MKPEETIASAITEAVFDEVTDLKELAKSLRDHADYLEAQAGAEEEMAEHERAVIALDNKFNRKVSE